MLLVISSLLCCQVFLSVAPARDFEAEVLSFDFMLFVNENITKNLIERFSTTAQECQIKNRFSFSKTSIFSQPKKFCWRKKTKRVEKGISCRVHKSRQKGFLIEVAGRWSESWWDKLFVFIHVQLQIDFPAKRKYVRAWFKSIESFAYSTQRNRFVMPV